jgi:hypothetical protein
MVGITHHALFATDLSQSRKPWQAVSLSPPLMGSNASCGWPFQTPSDLPFQSLFSGSWPQTIRYAKVYRLVFQITVTSSRFCRLRGWKLSVLFMYPERKKKFHFKSKWGCQTCKKYCVSTCSLKSLSYNLHFLGEEYAWAISFQDWPLSNISSNRRLVRSNWVCLFTWIREQFWLES